MISSLIIYLFCFLTGYDASCHNGITSVFSICGNNVCKKFLDWIYKDATIYLERKYKRYVDYYELNNSLSA